MVVDREIGESTMIRVSIEVRKMIEEEKIIPREPLNDCIRRVILEYREWKSKKDKDAIESFINGLPQIPEKK